MDWCWNHCDSSRNKKMIGLENNNNNDEDFASFATKMISSCLEDVVSHKNTRYQRVAMCVLDLSNTHIIILAEISAHRVAD